MTISKISPGLNHKQEPPELSADSEEGSTVPVLVICNHCKERLQIEINPGKIKSKLKGGLFSIEVPHGANNNAHSTIFYVSMANDRIQVRDQVTADHIVGKVSEKPESPHNEPNSGFSEIASPGEKQNTPKNITVGLLGGGIFLGGLGFSLWMNYDILSSLIIASYLSFVVRYSISVFKRKKSANSIKETPQYLDNLEGNIVHEPESHGVIISNNKTSRLFTIYQLLRGDSSELPQPLINLALSQHVPLLYMNEGNSQGFLAVENVLKGGAKKKHGVWIQPDISEKMRETIHYRSSLVEAVLKTGGIDFDRTSQLTGVLRLLQNAPQPVPNWEE